MGQLFSNYIYVFVLLSVNKVAFVVIGCENAIVAPVSQFITMHAGFCQVSNRI